MFSYIRGFTDSYLCTQGNVRINEFGDRETDIQVYQYNCRKNTCIYQCY